MALCSSHGTKGWAAMVTTSSETPVEPQVTGTQVLVELKDSEEYSATTFRLDTGAMMTTKPLAAPVEGMGTLCCRNVRKMSKQSMKTAASGPRVTPAKAVSPLADTKPPLPWKLLSGCDITNFFLMVTLKLAKLGL